jgi:hypothetical protein
MNSGIAHPLNRFVAHILAEHADENGGCYPSIARLSQCTGMSKRRVCTALDWLENAGHITRKQGGGRGLATRYTVHVVHSIDDLSELETVHVASETVHVGYETVHHTSETVHVVHTQPPEPPELPLEPPLAAKPRPAKNGTRLSPEWFLPKDWGEWSLSLGMEVGEVRTEAELFLNYWTSKAGKDARKLDWAAVWRTWCLNSIKWKGRGNGKQTRADGFTEALGLALGISESRHN